MRQDPLRRKSKNKRGTENKGKREIFVRIRRGQSQGVLSRLRKHREENISKH